MTYDRKDSALEASVRGQDMGEQLDLQHPRLHSGMVERPSVKGPELLAAALNPASISVIGASDNPNKIGGRPLLYLSRFGYKGRVYPINPHREEVQGLRGYPDIYSLPETPDLTIVAVPSPSVGAAVADCAARGVGAAIVMASGYGETADSSAI